MRENNDIKINLKEKWPELPNWMKTDIRILINSKGDNHKELYLENELMLHETQMNPTKMLNERRQKQKHIYYRNPNL